MSSIIASLVSYYNRAAAQPDADILPYGRRHRGIHFAICLDMDGTFTEIRDLRELNERRKFVPLETTVFRKRDRSSNESPEALHDKYSYIFVKNGKFIEFTSRIYDVTKDERVKAVTIFLQNLAENLKQIRQDTLHAEMIKKYSWLSFIVGEEDNRRTNLLCADKGIMQKMVDNESVLYPGKFTSGLCCLSGKQRHDILTEPPLKFFGGLSLITYNKDSLKREGVKNWQNAPMSAVIEHKFFTALNHLCKNKDGKLTIGSELQIVAWCREDDEISRQVIDIIFHQQRKEKPEDTSDPNKGMMGIRASIADLDKKLLHEKRGARYANEIYILGFIKPKKGRIAPVIWFRDTVKNTFANFHEHFSNAALEGERDVSLDMLALGIGRFEKEKNKIVLKSNLHGKTYRELFNAVLHGRRLPITFIKKVLFRCQRERAKWWVDKIRIAALQAYLKKSFSSTSNGDKQMNIADQIGFQLGRFLATVENSQYWAVSANTVSRLLANIHRNPAKAFVELCRKNEIYIKKLKATNPKKGWGIEKSQSEIIAALEKCYPFPNRLDTEQQAAFMLGYYGKKNEWRDKPDAGDQTDQ